MAEHQPQKRKYWIVFVWQAFFSKISDAFLAFCESLHPKCSHGFVAEVVSHFGDNRPEAGLAKGREVSLRKLAQASLSISTFKLARNALYRSFPKNTLASQKTFLIVIRVHKPTRNPISFIAPNLPLARIIQIPLSNKRLLEERDAEKQQALESNFSSLYGRIAKERFCITQYKETPRTARWNFPLYGANAANGFI